MSIGSLLALLIVAGICGGIGKSIAGYGNGGCLASIALGFIGSFLGMWIADELSLPRLFTLNIGGRAFPIIWSIIGSALFVAVLGWFSRRKD
ncbi:MAG: GlsB/YeaQ/YmgE family stress response membrane protein [Acidobacteria bacterium]|nr:GlsB/YeaQ/YmgE family stress response membrane protein [Acidobacteriota bacterium]